jgi:iron complex transport system permease protein
MSGAFLPTAIVASTWAQVGAAIVGSLFVLLLVLGVSSRVNDTVSLLIVGMMFGSIAGSVVNVLQSASNAESLKLFVMWSMGSLSSVTWQFLNVMAPIIIICLILSLLLPKKLNALLLGERYARGLGVSIGGIKITVIICKKMCTIYNI